MRKRIKWIVMLSFCLAMLFNGKASAAGNTMDTAKLINFGNTFSGTLNNNEEIYYKFTLPSSGRIMLTGSAEVGYGWYLNIYDEQRQDACWRDLDKSSIGELIDLTKGTYYLCLSNGSGDYSMQMSFTSAEESFDETGQGTNNTLFEANEISLNRIYKGQRASNDVLDYYKFTISEPTEITINMSPADGHNDVTLFGIIYDAQGSKLYEFYHNSVQYNLQRGTYYFVIDGNEFSTGNYIFKITDHSHTYENIITKATPGQDGKIVKKCVCGATDETVAIYAPKTLSLSAGKYTYNGKVKKPTVQVQDTEGKTISSSNYRVDYFGGCKNVGRYTVKVTFRGNLYSGNLSKAFDIGPGATRISKAVGGKRSLHVRWKKKVGQITGYQIQCSADKRFAKGNKTVTVRRNDVTSKKIKKLKARKKYYVRVRTYKNIKNGGRTVRLYSSWSKAKAVKTK